MERNAAAPLRFYSSVYEPPKSLNQNAERTAYLGFLQLFFLSTKRRRLATFHGDHHVRVPAFNRRHSLVAIMEI